MMRIYECRPSYENDRPQIDFEASENASNDWLAVAEVIDGTRPLDDFPAVAVTVKHPNAMQWDCYMDGGVRGLFSERFVSTVGMSSFQGLTLVPARLNGMPYFFLRCEKPVDCLDRSASAVEVFRSDPTAVKRITHYAFREDAVPKDSCFVLPELPDLLLTESVKQRIQGAKLRGVHLQLLP